MARDKERFIRAMKEGELHLDVPSQSSLEIELCSPMVENKRVAGVISIGGITRHHKRDLDLLNTIARLGAVALTNEKYVAERRQAADSDGLTGLFVGPNPERWILLGQFG